MNSDLVKTKKNACFNTTVSAQITNLSAATSSPPPQDDDPFPVNNLYICICLSAIILVGLVGNLVNVVVFSHRQMRNTSTFRFLLYLSVCDICVLLVCSTEALVHFGSEYEFRLVSTFACRLHTFLTYFLTHCSSTILMVISVDRALIITNRSISSIFSRKSAAINTPNKPSNYLNHGSARNSQIFFDKFHRVDLVMFGVVLSLALLNSHYLAFMNLNLITETNESGSRSSKSCGGGEEIHGINKLATTNRPNNENLEVSDVVAANCSASSPPASSFYVCFPLEGTSYNRFLMSNLLFFYFKIWLEPLKIKLCLEINFGMNNK